ncbi:ribosomal protein S18 acetylase RimI-like enzyme [Frondihabitans sp. PhB188]|uniref:GNAT family N-acetyltransferase n=1 Tax=Frondihabitans sp. PhB188 TaxID=2485200 RepID=UPI000F92DB15|nr:GNAT family N-acetyltransferase [Frondihabitans sp. PhB188]ROQ37376.1 ribosomal protein S18 acetylase RimI-like enzyme [Frondihabitans sp. PhB188]
MDQTTTPLRDRVIAPAEPVGLPEEAPRAQGRESQELPPVTWRRMRATDAAGVLAVANAAGLVDHPDFVFTLEEFVHDLAREELDPERDTVVAEDADGRMVAYGFAVLLPSQETLVRSSIPGAVHPDRRGEGIGTALLRWQVARAEEQFATSERALPGWTLTHADARATWILDLFERHGFGKRRWWLELTRDLAGGVEEVPLVPALRIQAYGPDWSERTRQARNEVFRDHWGSQPTTQADWEATAALPIARPDLSFVAVDPATDDVVAFVLTSVNEAEWVEAGHPFGYIEYVGVKREWRGSRVAQALLTRTMRAHAAAGLAHSVLDVDSESPTGATGLYEGLGFMPIGSSVSLVREY